MINHGFSVQKPLIRPTRNTVSSAKSNKHTSIWDIADTQALEHSAACVMVDTVGIRLDGVESTALPKRYTCLDDGDIPVPDSEWGKGALTSIASRQSIRVRATKSKTKTPTHTPLLCLTAEGSPAGHRQGHNIVSSGNVTALTYDMLRAIHSCYGVQVPVSRRLAIACGQDVEITRIDPGFLLECPSGLSKSAVINGLALAGLAAGCNISLYRDESAYFDQGSQTHSAKFYDKQKEVSRRRAAFTPDSPNWEHMCDLLKRTIRFESVFRKKYFLSSAAFKGLPVHPSMLPEETLAAMVIDALAGYNLKTSLRGFVREDELFSVPQPYRTTLALFQHGRNIRQFLGSERTCLLTRAEI